MEGEVGCHYILTLAYAVFFTIMFQMNALASVDTEIDEFIDRLRGEYESLKRTVELLGEFEGRITESRIRNLRFTAQEAADIVINDASPPLLSEGADFEWLPWSLRRLFRRSDFLRRKEKVINDHQKVIEKRMQVEGMCSQALNRLVKFVFQKMIIFGPSSILDIFSLILDEIEKQSTKIGQLHDMIQTQNSMLEQIMGASPGTVS